MITALSFSRVLSIAVILVGSLALVGWAFDIAALKSVLPALVALSVVLAITLWWNLRSLERADTELRHVEEALRTSQTMFQGLFESAPDAIVVVDREGRLKQVNRQAEQVFGYSRGELLNQPLELLLPERFREVHVGHRVSYFLAPCTRVMGSGLELVGRRKDGSEFPADVSLGFLETEQGVLVVGAVRDITERKRTEMMLQQAEAKYRSIFENAVEGIFQTTPEGRFLSANPATARMLGYESPAELMASIADLAQQGYVDPLRRTEFQRLIGQHGTVQGFEAQIYRKDGSVVWGSVSARAVRDASGALLYYEGTLEDITARKRAEEARQQEARISTALARVGQELIASLDTPTILDRLCQVTVEVLGCDQSSTILWQPQERVYVVAAHYGHAAEKVEILRALRVPLQAVAGLVAQLEEQEVVEVEPATARDPIVRSELQHFDVSAILYMALRRGGKLIGVQTASYRGRTGFSPSQKRIAQGIAQFASLALENARLLEQAQSASRLKSDFLATVSHELRTPLNIVLGYTELLYEGDFGALTAEQLEFLQRVRKAAYQELELITAMLDISRLEAGKIPLELGEVHVAELLGELATEVQDLLRQKPGLDYEWEVATDLPVLHTDPRKLTVVLKNLLSNAIKFTDRGKVRVEAGARDGGIEISVSDTGIGIPPEVQPVLFEMFRQGNSATTRRYGGTGLGLYIVKRMLELLGGTVTVESAVGKGSTFRVWVPNA